MTRHCTSKSDRNSVPSKTNQKNHFLFLSIKVLFHKVFNGPQPEDLPVLFFETKKLRMFAKTLVYIEIVNIVLVLLL